MFEKLKDLFRPRPSLSLYQESITRFTDMSINPATIYRDFHQVYIPVENIEAYIQLLQRANRCIESKQYFRDNDWAFKTVFKKDFFLGSDNAYLDVDSYFDVFVEELSYFLTKYEELENAISQTAADDTNLARLRYLAQNLVLLSTELSQENILS